MNHYFPYLVAALVSSFVLSLLSIGFCRRFAVYDHPTRRKQHPYPMPHLGGVAIFTSFWLVFGVAYCFSDTIQGELSRRMGYLFAASFVVFLTGLLDDLRNLTYVHKIFGQFLGAVIVISAGFAIPTFYIPFWRPIELGWVSYPTTVLWIIVLSNSINLIDGLDGLAGSVSIVVCLGMFLTGTLLGLESVNTVTVCLAGAVAGFLVLNWPPARLFMGDSGSLFIGFMFSLLAVICPIKSFTSIAMFVPLVAVGVPLIEVLVTFIRRTVAGQKFYVADNRHLYNYLQGFGIGATGTVLVLSAVSLAFAAFIPALFWFDRRKVFSIFLVFIVILFFVFFVVKLRRGQGHENGERHSS